MQAKQFRSSLAGLADESSSVALINIDVSVVLLSQLVNLVQRGDISIHREDSVSDDDSHPCLLRLLELFFQIGHIQVFEAELLSFTETDAVNNRGVVKGIADDCVLGTEDSLEETGIGIKSAGEKNGVFERVVVGDHTLQFLVDILCAANESDRAHTESV